MSYFMSKEVFIWFALSESPLMLGKQTGNSWTTLWISTVESCDSGHCHLLWSILLGGGMSSSHHVGLQQGSFQVNMMVIQGLVDSSQDLKDKRPK